MNRNKETRLSGQTERAEQSTERQVINEVVGEPLLTHTLTLLQPQAKASYTPAAALERSPADERYCKRCRSHGKDVGGRFLQDALHRPFWVCQRCCDKFDGRKGLGSLLTLTSDTTPREQTLMPLYQIEEA